MVSPDSTNPLYGVRGWLKFFVINALYISPIIFVALRIRDYFFYYDLDYHQFFHPLVFYRFCIIGFFVCRWMIIAIHLRNIRPRAVQEAKLWLKMSFGWIILDRLPDLVLGGGMSYDALGILIVTMVVALIIVAIWFSYFKVSKRVKATYTDWIE